MNRENELIKNTIILGFGKVLPKFITIITLPILTAKLTKTEYGTYDLISTLIMLLLPIATLQVQSAAFRFLVDCRDNKSKASDIITNIFIITLPISVVVAILLCFIWSSLSWLLRIIVCIYFILDILNLTISQVARGLGNNKEYSISSIILSLVNGLGIVAIVQLENLGLLGVIVSLCLANIFSILYIVNKINIFEYIQFEKISKETMKKLISYSWPMIPNNLSNWVLKLSDRFVITFMIGIEANATYAIANKIPGLLAIAQSIFVMAWQENASIAVKDKDASQYYTSMFEKVFKIMFGCTAALIGFTPIIFSLLIKGDYDEAYVQMPILILGMFFFCMSAFQGGIYIAHKKTKSVGITTVIAAICNFVLNILLIPILGVVAASITTTISYFLLYLFRVVDTRRFQHMKYNIKKQIIYLTIIIIMLILCFIRNSVFDMVNILLGCTFFIYANYEMMKVMIKKLKLGISK